MQLREHCARNDEVVQLYRADWEQVRRLADLFDAIIAAHDLLGADPEATIRRLAVAGMPPVIVLAGDAGEQARIAALDAGAAYCLTESVGARELAARVSAVTIRRTAAPVLTRHLVVSGEWILDLGGHRAVRLGSAPAEFTSAEFEVFSLLVACHERVLSRAYIAEHITTRDKELDHRTIDKLVSRVREKLRAADALATFNLRAVRNEGYVCEMPARSKLITQTRPPAAGGG